MEEDQKLVTYIARFGIWIWNQMPKHAGLSRSGKSCRLRWLNYLRPGIKRGNITKEEEEIIAKLHKLMGNRWAAIAAKLPQRTDNEIKNYFNTRMRNRKSEGFPVAESKNQKNDFQESSMEESSSNPIQYHLSDSQYCQAMVSVKEEEKFHINVGSFETDQVPVEGSNIDYDSFYVPFDDFFWATSFL
ncbi:hypothetical protein CCACVL1_02431 [Corchorus capsularis]|uniref:Uncharacterized protein n=1 Tax=Corchorus capsularis TaxID=210143 RepID=A0A1R3K8J9_COCAP|nr:hypothetical protein CCACVL1_02431 [Corchorus capsularis]